MFRALIVGTKHVGVDVLKRTNEVSIVETEKILDIPFRSHLTTRMCLIKYLNCSKKDCLETGMAVGPGRSLFTF